LISEAIWFFELDRERFKKVSLSASSGKTTISVLIYDDMGMAIAETHHVLDLGDRFSCDTTPAGVSFRVKGRTFDF
jgi:hypothetical protein